MQCRGPRRAHCGRRPSRVPLGSAEAGPLGGRWGRGGAAEGAQARGAHWCRTLRGRDASGPGFRALGLLAAGPADLGPARRYVWAPSGDRPVWLCERPGLALRFLNGAPGVGPRCGAEAAREGLGRGRWASGAAGRRAETFGPPRCWAAGCQGRSGRTCTRSGGCGEAGCRAGRVHVGSGRVRPRPHGLTEGAGPINAGSGRVRVPSTRAQGAVGPGRAGCSAPLGPLAASVIVDYLFFSAFYHFDVVMRGGVSPRLLPPSHCTNGSTLMHLHLSNVLFKRNIFEIT